jgi:hypothetical protein
LIRESTVARRKSHLRSPAAGQPQLVGLAWYDLAQWTKLKQVAEDAADLDESYQAWKRNAERTERQLSRRGIIIRCVAIAIDALVDWCRQRGKPVNGASRAEYAAEMVRGPQSSPGLPGGEDRR